MDVVCLFGVFDRSSVGCVSDSANSSRLATLFDEGACISDISSSPIEQTFIGESKTLLYPCMRVADLTAAVQMGTMVESAFTVRLANGDN